MKGSKDKEFINLRNKFLLGFLIFAVFATLLYLIFVRQFSLARPISSKMKKDETFLVFINGNDCENCNEIEAYLKDKKVEFEQLNELSSEAKTILEENNFDTKKSITPAVLYIKNGKLYANLVNINSTIELELFIKNYKLSK